MKLMKSRFANYIFTFFVACSIHAKTPNVVIMFMDDLGYATSAHSGQSFPTPNLDRMAKEEESSPTSMSRGRVFGITGRVDIGCYNVRVEFCALGPKSNIGINPEEDTIAEICKQKGYTLPASESGIWDIIKNFFPCNMGLTSTSACPTQ